MSKIANFTCPECGKEGLPSKMVPGKCTACANKEHGVDEEVIVIPIFYDETDHFVSQAVYVFGPQEIIRKGDPLNGK